MKTKIYNFIQNINCFFLVLAAIFTVTKSPFGSPLFVYTSTVGLIDAIKTKKSAGYDNKFNFFSYECIFYNFNNL